MELISALVVLFLGVISLCLMTLTFLIFITSRQVRWTLRKIQTLLPLSREVLEEARSALSETDQLIHRTHEMTRAVEKVVQRSCDGTSAILDNLFLLKERARAFLKGHFENGSGRKPRRLLRVKA